MPRSLKSGQSKSFADTTADDVARRVADIIADIRDRGDEAVRHYSQTFDRWDRESYRLSAEEIADLIATLPQQVLDDIAFVQEQVRHFARIQRDALADVEVETLPGCSWVIGTSRFGPQAPTSPAAGIR